MFAIIDTETTGGHPGHSRITEIAILIHNGKRVIRQFNTLINPEREIPPFIVAMTGISNSMASRAPVFRDVASQIAELTQDHIFVAHNARFDYSMLRAEYKRLGERFTRKQLCTVKLGRKVLPGHRSYSLGSFCKDLGIPIDGRHRAYGDAEATTQLLERLLFNERRELNKQLLEEEISVAKLPPQISREQIDNLPEETGVYYFLDHRGKVLYVGKSKNIQGRILTHFGNDLSKKRFRELKELVHDISYELTGSELLALLLESYEIKRFMPPFNKASRRKRYRHALYLRESEMGRKHFHYGLLNGEEDPLIKFTSKWMATKMISNLSEKYNLHPALFSGSASTDMLPADIYHRLQTDLNKLLAQYFYPKQSFFIICEGRHLEEHGLVWVEQQKLKGFGYFDINLIDDNLESLKDMITHYPENPDAKRIVLSWLKRKPRTKVVEY